MNIVMFTPAVVESAIGYSASLVSRHLNILGHKLTIVRAEGPHLFEMPTHAYKAPLIYWNDTAAVEQAIAGADVLFYHIGDNYPFHQGCIAWLSRFPGIVCLHDFYVANLFFSWGQTWRHESYKILRVLYVEKVADAFFNFSDSDSFVAHTSQHSPLTEWICSMAYGVITHSAWGMPRVLASCPGPVYICPLPYDLPCKPSSQGRKKEEHDSFTILTFGHINPNKRIASVIEALRSSALLRNQTTYHLVGAIGNEEKERYESMANERGVNIVISGRLEDPELMQAIDDADVVTCLRWPSLEAASATAIMAMLFGKPTIVTNTGFYRDLPDDCVMKIEQKDEINQLQQALERLYKNPHERAKLAESAKAWASQTFSAMNYAEKMVQMAESVNRAKPILNAVKHFSDMMERWGATGELMNLKETIEPLKIFEKDNMT